MVLSQKRIDFSCRMRERVCPWWRGLTTLATCDVKNESKSFRWQQFCGYWADTQKWESCRQTRLLVYRSKSLPIPIWALGNDQTRLWAQAASIRFSHHSTPELSWQWWPAKRKDFKRRILFLHIEKRYTRQFRDLISVLMYKGACPKHILLGEPGADPGHVGKDLLFWDPRYFHARVCGLLKRSGLTFLVCQLWPGQTTWSGFRAVNVHEQISFAWTKMC